ncbi:MAG: hypothetical protein A2W91_06945 [Bacteroidetes bacterium GWF2_38_335]|nr:MAG: hypothetical protein A2W91_06945 [Bacteroidetes bacterium GWF2_38_335]OFY80888.1 MAG: hypothetical protein A2281_04760 [Bacteroidetes bacterium RIFOXYA12_FULL_38_20]HBS84954.1 hypothetical protein [Bacteroidales bacterium]
MKEKKTILKFIFVLCIAAFISSCNTTKKTVTVEKERDKKLKQIPEKKLISHLQENYLKYDNFSAKVNVKFVYKDKDQSVKAQIKIQKDSLIWISIIPALGIEFARAQFSMDSVKFINRMSNEYFVGDYKYVSEMFHLDLNYEVLQALLMNELFIYPSPDDSIKLRQYFKSEVDSSNYILESTRERKIKRQLKKNRLDGLVEQNIKIIPETFKIEHCEINDYGAELIFEIDYSDFEQLEENSLFPNHSRIEVKYGKEVIQISLKYSKPAVNKKDINFNFVIPEDFKKIK